LLSAVVVGIVVAAGLGWFSFARYSDDRPIFPDLVGLTEAAAVSQITSRGNQVDRSSSFKQACRQGDRSAGKPAGVALQGCARGLDRVATPVGGSTTRGGR
jgi:hypothetical protein